MTPGEWWAYVRAAEAADVVVAAAYSAMLAAVATEVGWRWVTRPDRRRDLVGTTATAATMAAGAVLVGVGFAAAVRVLWALYARLGPEALASWWVAHPVPAAAAAFVAWDASAWAYHVLGHRTRLGWAAHQPHHTGTGYDLTLGLRQTWMPVHGLVTHPPLALLGFELRLVLACAAASGLWQFLVHTAVPVRTPRWVAAVVVTPATHRHHHGRGAAPVNLGAVLTVWDRLAGTWVPADAPAPSAYGPASGPTGPVAVQLAGWRSLAAGGAWRVRTTVRSEDGPRDDPPGSEGTSGHGRAQVAPHGALVPARTPRPGGDRSSVVAVVDRAGGGHA